MSNDTMQMDQPIKKSCNPTCQPNCNPSVESDWMKAADSFLILAFAVGIYAQIFSFFLYAFATNT